MQSFCTFKINSKNIHKKGTYGALVLVWTQDDSVVNLEIRFGAVVYIDDLCDVVSHDPPGATSIDDFELVDAVRC